MRMKLNKLIILISEFRLNPSLLDLATRHVSTWIGGVCATDLSTAMAHLIRNTLICIRLSNVLVGGESLGGRSLSGSLIGFFTFTSCFKVGILEELNALRG